MAPTRVSDLGSAASAPDAPDEPYAFSSGGAVGGEDRIFEGDL